MHDQQQPVAAATLAHLRRCAGHPEAYVVTVAAGDLLALLDAYERRAAAEPVRQEAA